MSVRSPHFQVLDEFIDTSYKDRYQIFCNKLLLERQYSAACFMTTNKSEHNNSYICPNDKLSYLAFIRSMLGAVLAHFLGGDNL